MAKRHSDALGIQQGACNPRGIVHSIQGAFAEISAEPNQGTVSFTHDPAIRLMVHQLAFICGITSGAEELHQGTWEGAMRVCRERQTEPNKRPQCQEILDGGKAAIQAAVENTRIADAAHDNHKD